MDHASKGAAAIAASDFTAAITHYTNAINAKSDAVNYWIQRSTAYTRLSPPDHTAACQDAEIAVALAYKRSTHELIVQSQLRRGIALFKLQQWGNAKQCFTWVKERDEKAKSVDIWLMQVDEKLKHLPEDDPSREVHVPKIPDVKPPEREEKRTEKDVEQDTEKKQHETVSKTAQVVPEATGKVENEPTPVSRIRHEWFQTTDSVTITLFAKGVPKDKTVVELKTRSLSLNYPHANGSDFEFTLDPLYADIDETSSTSKIMSTKVEFILKKATPGQKWHAIEGAEPAKNGNTGGNADEEIKRVALGTGTGNSVPSYPTSSKSGPKNWDKVAQDLSKKPKKEGEQEQDEEDTGFDDDIEGGDPANHFFQQLYKNADPDTRRAMMKSYQESNGTALSTNWAEVSKGPVETSPPDGMVAKKWNE